MVDLQVLHGARLSEGGSGGAPLLLTSYSWEEADDDCGQLEEWGLREGGVERGGDWAWEPVCSLMTPHPSHPSHLRISGLTD
jgi:hypothetical protein